MGRRKIGQTLVEFINDSRDGTVEAKHANSASILRLTSTKTIISYITFLTLLVTTDVMEPKSGTTPENHMSTPFRAANNVLNKSKLSVLSNRVVMFSCQKYPNPKSILVLPHVTAWPINRPRTPSIAMFVLEYESPFEA